MKQMWRNFDKMNNRKNGVIEIPFKFNDKGHTIEPIEEGNLTDFNKDLKKALDFSPKKK